MHQQHLVAKKQLGGHLHDALNIVIKVVNHVKSNSLQDCLFHEFCCQNGGHRGKTLIEMELSYFCQTASSESSCLQQNMIYFTYQIYLKTIYLISSFKEKTLIWYPAEVLLLLSKENYNCMKLIPDVAHLNSFLVWPWLAVICTVRTWHSVVNMWNICIKMCNLDSVTYL